MSDDLSGAIQSVAWDSNFHASNVHGAGVQLQNLKAVIQYCKRRRIAVDVGAHIGLWSKPLAERFQKVWAFEPVQENMECLRRNVTAANVEFIECALSEYADSLCEMTLPDSSNSGCWYMRAGFQTPMTTLDSCAIDDVDLLKIDVEGAEGSVLKGAIETLKRFHPVVVFEDNGLGLKHYGKQWVDPRTVLSPLGYAHVARVRKDEVWRLP